MVRFYVFWVIFVTSGKDCICIRCSDAPEIQILIVLKKSRSQRIPLIIRKIQWKNISPATSFFQLQILMTNYGNLMVTIF